MKPNNRRRKSAVHSDSSSDRPRLSQHRVLDGWLAQRVDIQSVFERLEPHIVAGAVSSEDVILLAKKWRDALPPRRGVVKRIADYMQLGLALDPSILARNTRKRRRRKNGRRSLL
jgi:hypothetical protein